MSLPPGIGFVAGLFLALAAGIAWRQRKAKTCPQHSRYAGFAAWVLAGLCGVVGALLIALIYLSA